ncbi:MAG: hypothetical protein ACYCOR_12715 [Acidobacteriaceae bacterium]
MILDTQLQLNSGWKTHTQADGSNIGGVPPVNYGFAQCLPGAPTAMLFHMQGSTVAGGYADWEAYLDRPVFPNTGNLQLSFDLAVDENAAQYAQCIEIDTILCLGGFKYNFSHQLNYAAGGVIDIAGAAGGWVSTGNAIGHLTPNVAHHYVLSYQFGAATHVYSFAGIEIDGVAYAIPAALQNLTAQATAWSDGAMLQVQQDLNALAGQFSMTLDNVQYQWT